jgi:hypothetical protein
MGFRFHRNFGLSSRSPTQSLSQDAAAPLAARPDDMIVVDRPRHRHQVVAGYSSGWVCSPRSPLAWFISISPAEDGRVPF